MAKGSALPVMEVAGRHTGRVTHTLCRATAKGGKPPVVRAWNDHYQRLDGSMLYGRFAHERNAVNSTGSTALRDTRIPSRTRRKQCEPERSPCSTFEQGLSLPRYRSAVVLAASQQAKSRAGCQAFLLSKKFDHRKFILRCALV